MNKTLVIITHPNMATSSTNQRLMQELAKYPERYTIHELYKTYPDGKIDVAAEQKLVETHNHLVFQFPVYWFSSPPLLKQWFDEVLTHGWAYGSKGKKLAGKKLGIAVSFGAKEKDYQKDGNVGYTPAEVLRPFEITAQYVEADYQPIFTAYTVDTSYGATLSDEDHRALEQTAQNYLAYLEQYFA